MIMSQLYLAVSIVILAIIGVLEIAVNKNKTDRRLTPLFGLAAACILAGILFGEERFLGYGLLAVGVVLAVVDMIRKMRVPKPSDQVS